MLRRSLGTSNSKLCLSYYLPVSFLSPQGPVYKGQLIRDLGGNWAPSRTWGEQGFGLRVHYLLLLKSLLGHNLYFRHYDLSRIKQIFSSFSLVTFLSTFPFASVFLFTTVLSWLWAKPSIHGGSAVHHEVLEMERAQLSLIHTRACTALLVPQ